MISKVGYENQHFSSGSLEVFACDKLCIEVLLDLEVRSPILMEMSCVGASADNPR